MKPFIAFACLLVLLQSSTAFDPITLTVGTTAYVLTGTQVALAVAGLAGLAITKEKLLLAGLSRRASRGRRDLETNDLAVEPLELGPFFDAVATADVSGCGQKLVCHVMAKPAESRTADEARLAALFDDLTKINPASGYANYQLAAFVGTLGEPDLCDGRYALCPVTRQGLEDVLEAHN